jgi:hypothetical protein
VSFPRAKVEILRHTALHTNPVALAISRKRPAQIVLPATQYSIHEALRRMVQRSAALRIIVVHSLVQYCYALHFNLLLLPSNAYCPCQPSSRWSSVIEESNSVL